MSILVSSKKRNDTKSQAGHHLDISVPARNATAPGLEQDTGRQTPAIAMHCLYHHVAQCCMHVPEKGLRTIATGPVAKDQDVVDCMAGQAVSKQLLNPLDDRIVIQKHC